MLKKGLLTIIFIGYSLSGIGQEWVQDLAIAKKEASQENKRIILVFQGSDWCAPCIKLDREIWSAVKFKDYSKDNYVLLKADFPRKKKNKLSKSQHAKNTKLAEMYNASGFFPFVVVLDKTGKVLGETGYKKIDPEAYIKLLNSF